MCRVCLFVFVVHLWSWVFRTAGAFSPPLFRSNGRHAHTRDRGVSQSFVIAGSTLLTDQREQNESRDGTIVFQKVVRAPREIPEALFLGTLVEYLQDRFQLPETLPMVYEKESTEDTATNNVEQDPNLRTAEPDRSVVRWNSPLSPCAQETVLDVQIVALYPQSSDSTRHDEENNLLCKMAMVAVGKRSPTSTATTGMPPLLKNLFRESENLILRALDRGLDDFAAGRIRFDPAVTATATTSSLSTPIHTELSSSSRLDQAKQSMWTEFEEEYAQGANMSPPTIVVPDMAESTDRTRPQPSPSSKNASERRDAALRVLQAKAIVETEYATRQNENNAGLDFAVRAAQQQQLRQKRNKRGNETTQTLEDYAVAQARKRASKQQLHQPQQQQPQQESIERDTNVRTYTEQAKIVEAKESRGDIMDGIDIATIRPPCLDLVSSGRSRSFSQTISHPSEYMKNRAKREETGRPTSLKKTNSSTKGNGGRESTPSDKISSSIPTRNTSGMQQRKININIKEDRKEPQPFAKDDSDDITAPEQRQMIQATEAALDEMAMLGNEMSPEELLQSVMKFGSEQDNDSTPGQGFVSGAFEKAKDLLRQQREQREERLKEQVAVKAAAAVQENSYNDDRSTRKREKDILNPEEELRQMFEAGERIAERSIEMVAKSTHGHISQLQDDVDALIASNKDISGHARILDDDLAELEVRVNRSPYEVTDDPAKNTLFDIFSGPEIFNPNVDPETSVNWPGATLGTRHVRLPKELDEAVRQSRFAAEAIMSLQEEKYIDDGGTEQSRYTFKGRFLESEQIERLKTAWTEAVEIGLIQDPLELAQEASRLQMLLVELWDQPEDRFREIFSEYKDLFLSENFVFLIKQRLSSMADRDIEALRNDDDSVQVAHKRERDLIGKMVAYAQLLLKEVRALGAELEAQQLEVIRSICKVAMDPIHQTEEDTTMALTDTVRDMRPLFDDAFIAYLKYAVGEEEGRLARAGVLDDPEQNQWLFVLKIVQQGVYAEIATGIGRYIDHISYVLRMETAIERRMLLSNLIDVMPSLDVRPFVQVVENIAGALGESSTGDFEHYVELGEMTKKILQLQRDVKELLPPDRIAQMSRDADEWAAKRRQILLQQRNETKMRLKAAQDTAYLDAEVDSLGRRGETERFD